MYGEGNQETPWKGSVPICHVYREYSGRNAALAEGNKESLYTDFLLSLSGSPGAWEAKRILQNTLKQDNIKNTDTILCSMSPHSRTTSSRRLQDFPVCSALAPDSERPAILSGTDLYPCFCAVFLPHEKSSPSWSCFHCKKLLIRPMLMRGRAQAFCFDESARSSRRSGISVSSRKDRYSHSCHQDF